MQAVRQMIKLIRLRSKFPSWKSLKAVKFRKDDSNKNSEIFQDKRMQEIKR